MAVKITGYAPYISTGGNRCVQCNTRMRKGLPYLSPITGKRVVKELRGKSICVACLNAISEDINEKLKECGKESYEIYTQKRFLEHLDKD